MWLQNGGGSKFLRQKGPFITLRRANAHGLTHVTPCVCGIKTALLKCMASQRTKNGACTISGGTGACVPLDVAVGV